MRVRCGGSRHPLAMVLKRRGIKSFHLLRDRAPAGMEIGAGEYGYETAYFRRLLECGAIDVLRRTRRVASGSADFSP